MNISLLTFLITHVQKMFVFSENTCDPRERHFENYGLTSGKDGGSHRLKGTIKYLLGIYIIVL